MSTATKRIEKFRTGQLAITPNAMRTIRPEEAIAALMRHVSGDWGEIDEDDRAENELSLREGFRVMSVYRTGTGDKFWIITEADRSSTTILMPEDY